MSDHEDRDDGDHFQMPEPQWGRVTSTDSRADMRDGSKLGAHGDPIRWGSDQQVEIPNEQQLWYSPQLIKVERASPYPCNWQLIGYLQAPGTWWASTPDQLQWIAGLEVIMGVGQSRVTHTLNLRAAINLCVTPALLLVGLNWYFPNINGDDAYPWVISGGIVGKSIQVRAFFGASSGEVPLTPATVRIGAFLAPFNAGGERE